VTRANVEASLDAVEQALEHFVSSLDRAGYANGAAAYRQMAEIIVGQWAWAQQNDAGDLVGRFLRVADLAANVGDQLRPYVGAMDQLRALRGLAAAAWGIEAGSGAEKIVAALGTAREGMTSSELRRATGLSTVALRSALNDLIDKGAVARSNGARGRFALAGADRAGPRRSG
jgi:hypothetical protein